MELISLSEFLRITLLNDRDVLIMLERGELVTAQGPSGELLINLSEVDEKLLAARGILRPLGIEEADRELLEEIIASELIAAVDEVIDDALEMALRWQKESPSSDGEKG